MSQDNDLYSIGRGRVLRRIEEAKQYHPDIGDGFTTALYIVGAIDIERVPSHIDQNKQIKDLLEPVELSDATLIGILSGEGDDRLSNLLVIDPNGRYDAPHTLNGNVIYREGHKRDLQTKPAKEALPEMLDCTSGQLVDNGKAYLKNLGIIPYRVKPKVV
jgi:hypothetical protein